MPEKFPTIDTDAFVIMPNHSHGIIVITNNVVGGDLRVAPDSRQSHGIAPPSGPTSLPTVIQWFKTMTTNEYIHGVRTRGWAPFPGKLWQRNYYEHVIRNEIELNAIRRYIHDNPAKWEQDRDNPIRIRPAAENTSDYLNEIGL